MQPARTITISDQLKGTPVLDPDTAYLVGRVTDLIVHPTEGRIMGLLLRTPGGKERVIAAENFHIFNQVSAVIAAKDRATDWRELCESLVGGVSVCAELIGSSVVTEEGQVLGQISEVMVHEESQEVTYRVTSSRLQAMLGGGFWMSGRRPFAWLRDQSQLVVPADPHMPQPVPAPAWFYSAFPMIPLMKGAGQ